ncbi:MAG TPA: 4'-phosphopantetheinyl transferase superfamily protein [Chitinophagaceae bacterium]|nr:4'-phosphopantetheinyl transferase superfamily protein [Chitinophagaceae bacterium]
MKSIGNDIVALKSINKKRTKQILFYSKILSVSEQALYYKQGFEELSFEKFVWLLWSVKESVYKYLKRSVPDLVFSPTKIIIQRIELPYRQTITKFGSTQWENKGNESCENFYRGIITFGPYTFYFRSKIHAELISTVVNDGENFENIWWGIKSIDDAAYNDQSKEVRAFILNKLNSTLSGCNDNLSIEKCPLGYPVVLKEAKEMDIPVSLAHHDHFIAYSFLSKNP